MGLERIPPNGFHVARMRANAPAFEDEAAALSALEDWIAGKRQGGFDLKIPEWKPFGLLG